MNIFHLNTNNKFALFLFISGMGALWLSFIWLNSISDNLMSNYDKNVFVYYIFNSILLILISGSYYKNKNKVFSVFSILLLTSVLSSLFIVEDGFSLFFETIDEGIVFGFLYGGIILVPMFLISVIAAAIKAFQFFFFNKEIDKKNLIL